MKVLSIVFGFYSENFWVRLCLLVAYLNLNCIQLKDFELDAEQLRVSTVNGI
jgi:hypothetical protein